MAAKTQLEKPVEEVMKNLKVDPSSKLGGAKLAPPKDRSLSDATSCISSSGDATSSLKEGDIDQESLMAEQGFYYPASSYYGYCYPGYDGSAGEWDDQGYFLSSDGLEIQYPAIQADNGSLMYYMPGFQPGYVPYSPYLPGATFGVDGQYLGQQQLLLSPMSTQSIASPGYFPTPLPYGSEVVPSYLWDPSLLAADGVHGDGYGGVTTVPGTKSNFSAPNHTHAPIKSMPSAKSSNVGTKGSLPALDVSSGPGFLNELKPVNKVSQHVPDFQSAAVLAKGYFPISKFPSSNQGKGGLLYPNSPVNFKANARGWGGAEKFKTRGKANGISDFDLLNEQNRGPRTTNAKTALPSGVDSTDSLVSEVNDSNDSSTTVIRRDQYNLPDFTTKYDHALFFVIKSYSEDDIHKSIKYNVWASTPNGNKRLDSAYQDAQERMGQKDSKCPVFLFFSVNASGQFCGVAEMIGRVDFNKNMDFWQQDKWNGFFPVKWHIIKDVPNPHFRHIILENNDNKPVTNSRDTQEVRLPQGIEMLNIFKNYSSKTSILDDFAFYESRQKAMQEKRTRPSTPHLGLLQKPDEVTQVTASLESIDLAASKNEEVQMGDKAKE
ncbi:YTH domain [Macleaya cordata]|uniref:YTH domain-containing family protein n=1 Tax=Macleaya cordata TaxID=56857 RepID=A0A200PT57_MACCD|nr:YTH domain [Macleaya cordata]